MWISFSLKYGDAPIHTAVRHDHVHLLPYLLAFQYLPVCTRNGTHKEVEHVNLQNEVSLSDVHKSHIWNWKSPVRKERKITLH